MKPRVLIFRTPVREAAPQAIAIARGLGWLFGKAIKGDNGTIEYGYPSIQTQRTKYAGYAFPPQIFTGYDPRKVAAGFIRPDQASLPGEPIGPGTSPLSRAMQGVTISQIAKG